MDFNKMTDKQLIELINAMMYYDEIPYALDELVERTPKIAFELGMDILIKDKGDDFLQACVWSTCSFINYKKMFRLITQRISLFGWSTLETMLCFITNSKITDILPKYKQQIVDSYNNISEEKRNELSKIFDDFLELTNNR